MSGLGDVARAAGVSPTTASRALSGRGRISEATRARVRAAAERLGYVPSATAAALASGRARNVGVIVPLTDRWFFATVLDGIAGRLATYGYDLTLYNVADDPDQRRRVFDVSLRRGRVDALIVLSVALSAPERAGLRTLGLPVVGLGVRHTDLTGPRVDDAAVGATATEHLVTLGHRRIVHLGLPAAPVGADATRDIPTQRRLGYERAMAAASLRAHTVAADFTVPDAQRVARSLLRGPDRPTAIFAASDEMAFGVIATARALGLSVPTDLSVIGVDGHELGELFDLTTIDQFPHAQGQRVGDAILAALGEVDAPDSDALPFELVVRGSTAPPPN